MNHEYYMQHALELAQNGWPNVAPNPMVGCVIVRGDKVVASGYHEYFGEAHAEVNAINHLAPNVYPSECVLYVTLEPCSHQGKTPPCVDLIIQKGFKTVVVACKDPNPLVAGKGIKKLKDAGFEVITGVLEEEARSLNKHFVVFHEKKRPYLIIKWAQTADGFISKTPVPQKKEDNMITRAEAQVYVHKIRSEVMGVLVGKNTVLNDNPFLTTRLVKGKNAARIFMDRNLEVPLHYNIFNKEARTIVFNSLIEESRDNISFIKIDFSRKIIPQMLDKLYRMDIQSLLVEGGAHLINDLVTQDLWDEVLVFQNPDLYFKDGLKAPVFALKNTFELVGNDKLYKHVRHEGLPRRVVAQLKEIF
jgi:diaminohydroxyphosphoribosylaminopyrimidine deaminase/5-amino-6-(5-phosphoribosylamino)uracil reductase